jgi:hypothetical protein
MRNRTSSGLTALRCGFALHLFVILQAAAQVDPARVEAWLRKEWSRASRFPSIKGFSIRWRVEQYSTPPKEEIERMRSEIHGKPDHPEQHSLKFYEERLQGKPTIFRHELWSRDEGRWRYNLDAESGSYFDWSVTTGRSWQLTRGSIYHVKPSDDLVPGHNYALLTGSFRWCAALLLHGPVGMYAGMYAPESIVVDGQGGRWEIVGKPTAPSSGLQETSVVIWGLWDDVAG